MWGCCHSLDKFSQTCELSRVRPSSLDIWLE
nr:protein R10E8.7 [imported] - Caenorhabditis elegans [Caenorhabditis elegans]